MAVREYNFTPGANEKSGIADTGTATAVSGGAANLGGTIGVRLLLDDAVMPSKTEVLRAIRLIEMRLLERDWPPA